MRRERSADSFILLATVSGCLFSLAVSLPYLGAEVARFTGVDPLALVGNGSVLGPGKITLLTYLAWALAAGLILIWALGLGRPGRMARSLALLGVLSVLYGGVLWLEASPYGGLAERLRVSQASKPVIMEWTASAMPQTFDALTERIVTAAAKNDDRLAEAWDGFPPALHGAIFAMTAVADLWPFDPAAGSGKVGCALTPSVADQSAETAVRGFFSAATGCCSDYAFTLKRVLDDMGVDNDVIHLPINGHLFNQVRLNEGTYLLDATTNLVVAADWTTVNQSRKPLDVVLFPRRDTAFAADHYQPEAMRFRAMQLQVLARGGATARVLRDLPAFFRLP